ncbi:lamin tail domain-containing protein, partial [bacterium]|nr:lamin tail domain-containing protein [bacterium]
MIIQRILLSLLFSVCLIPAYAGVVINEIHFNPDDLEFESGTLREFIELYNSGPESVDLTGYQFVNGLTYTFPDGAVLE